MLRYIKDGKKPTFSAETILSVIVLAICVVYYVLFAFGKFMFRPDSVFYRSLNLFSGAGDPNPIIRLVSYVIFILSVSYVVRCLLYLGSKPLKKGRAIVDIICSLIKYAAVIILIFMVLKSFGVDTTAILAGIGILGLIVGLGAQPLIADIIAGLFIVFENVFDVGDIIVVDGFRGTVKEIGIRTTKIEDAGGNIKIVNNSDLRTVVNMTEQLSLAVCDLSIEYGESIERVEAILKKNLDDVKKNIPEIKDGPIYKGIAELGESAVIMRFIAKCEEGSRYQVERDMNRQFKLLFDKNGINIPFPQVVVNQPSTFEDATKKQKKDAEQFVVEQKELGKNLPDGERNDF
ncbi:MAG: mechanosensitive ion channel family protein [Clostridia bacterium]|nr:mechanosensitive ion channel family protein [Clostridia bacterium]